MSHINQSSPCFIDEERNCIQEVGTGVQIGRGMTKKRRKEHCHWRLGKQRGEYVYKEELVRKVKFF
jgi:hypothetical protein